MARAPAGWYADARCTGAERWFDGTSWTDRRRLVTGSALVVDDDTTSDRTSPADGPVALWLRTVLVGAGLAVASTAVGLLALLLTG